MMKILGLDLSSKRSGYGVFVDGRIASHGVIDFHKEDDDCVRDRLMMVEVGKLIVNERPDRVIIEDSFCKQNVAVTKHLSYIIGAAMYQCHIIGITPEVVMPSHWRSVVGLGLVDEENGKKKRGDLKRCAVKMVSEMFGFDPIEDEAEAVLIALSGVYGAESSSLFE